MQHIVKGNMGGRNMDDSDNDSLEFVTPRQSMDIDEYTEPDIHGIYIDNNVAMDISDLASSSNLDPDPGNIGSHVSAPADADAVVCTPPDNPSSAPVGRPPRVTSGGTSVAVGIPASVKVRRQRSGSSKPAAVGVSELDRAHGREKSIDVKFLSKLVDDGNEEIRKLADQNVVVMPIA